MRNIHKNIPKEVVWHLTFSLFIFIVSSINKDNQVIHLWQVIFFLNNLITGLLISYWILPYYLYNNKYRKFTFYLLCVLLINLSVDNFVLEEIFFAEDTTRNNWLAIYFSIIESFPVIFLISLFKYVLDAQKNIRKLAQIKTSYAEGQMKFLKNQLSAHFLFNNLNNLYYFALNKSPKTPEIILQISSLLRYVIYENKNDYVPMHKELEHVKSFINLQKLQLSNRGIVAFTIRGNMTNKTIAPLLLITIIENCFKHSLSSQPKGIIISIDIEISDFTLKMNCSNTFANHTNLLEGIGLENLKTRLKILYPMRHTLVFKVQSNVYNVVLEINLHND